MATYENILALVHAGRANQEVDSQAEFAFNCKHCNKDLIVLRLAWKNTPGSCDTHIATILANTKCAACAIN